MFEIQKQKAVTRKESKKKDSFRVTASNTDAIVGAYSGVCTYAKRRTYLVFRIEGGTFYGGNPQGEKDSAQPNNNTGKSRHFL